MISIGKLKATEIANGTQRNTYKLKSTDIEALGTIGDEKVTKPKRRRGGNQKPYDGDYKSLSKVNSEGQAVASGRRQTELLIR